MNLRNPPGMAFARSRITANVGRIFLPLARQVELTLGLAKQLEGLNQGLYAARTC
jgi:hypothetical protein